MIDFIEEQVFPAAFIVLMTLLFAGAFK